MANMTFKANLVPQTDYGYELGSTADSKRWKINGQAGGPVEYIVGTQTASTGAWVGTTKDSTLVTGKMIAYKLPFAGSGSASLALTYTNPPSGAATNSGAIPIYLNNTRVTTHYAANSVIIMVYDGTNWRSTDYWNSNSRDAGYGKISLTQSTGTSAVTTNTTQLAAATYNEAMTLTAGNKWVQFAGTNGAAGADVLTVGHALSGVTAKTAYGSTANTASANGGSITVTDVQFDAAGHITASTDRTITLSQTTYSAATTNAAGLMSAADKTKLDGIAAGATNFTYTLPTATSSVKGGIKVGTGLAISSEVLNPNWATATPSKVSSATGAVGSENTVARGDHTHQIDVSSGTTNGYVVVAGKGVQVKGINTAAYQTSGTFATASHAHGNITSGGDMTATATIASGDRLVINDESASKLTSSDLTFGTSTNYALSNAGSWQKVVNTINGSDGTVTLSNLNLFGKSYNGSAVVDVTPADIGLNGSMNFRGIVTNNLSDGSTTSPVTLKAGGSVTPAEGDVVIDSGGEQYVWSNGAWRALGYATDYALNTHIHGNILNNGTISATATIGAGTRLVITDTTGAVTRSSISFTSSTSKYLREDGSWQTVTTTDKNVQQNAAITTAGNYPVILAASTATTITTSTLNKTSTLLYNPSTTVLTVPKIKITTASYGDALPTSNLEAGLLFFQTTSNDLYEIPTGGRLGAPLVHLNSNTSSRVVAWQNQFDFSANASARFKMIDVTKGTTPSINHWQGIYFMDNSDDPESGDKAYGYIGSLATNTGKVETRMYVYDATATAAHNCYLYAAADGIGDSYMRTGSYNAPFYGAVWNDYAEFRETKDNIQPGRCIKEIGDDTLELTTDRLERGCEIVSDTFGFAIGETKKAKTPTAASGRVLAYLYEDRELAKNKIGWPVCSGPNGTVSIMTEEEEEKYPSRIIGTISAVPDYEIWYANCEQDNKDGYKPREIKVDGRIWIRVR